MNAQAPDAPPPPQSGTAFRSVPRTGVIYVMTEAAKYGYTPGSTDWANLGQGQPEPVGEQRADLAVGLAAGRRGGHPDLHGGAQQADDLRTRGTGDDLDLEAAGRPAHT